MASGLYGIHHSNRKDGDHWGKNCFNSSFPAAMASYMMDHDINAMYITYVKEVVHGESGDREEMKLAATEIPIRTVFNCGDKRPEDLFFAFESVYEPYQKYSFDSIDCIDLVIKDLEGKFLSPLEVKLTVMPDNTTCTKPEDQWGTELVIRSATTSYCAIGMYDAVKDNAADIREIFEEACSSIQNWDNDFEMTHKLGGLCRAVDAFEKKYYEKQKPLLMQTIWKTQGKSPMLADNAFDIVIWSDYAFSRLFVDSSYAEENTMKRPMRATARLAKCLWELSKSGKIRIVDIYRQMAFGNQTDKEFAVPGMKWKSFVRTPRTASLKLSKTVVHDILTDGAIEQLSPERRFDQTLYFTMRTTARTPQGGNLPVTTSTDTAEVV